MLTELNHVIDYIEDHLTDDDLSLEIISEYAGVSDYHFRKVFFYLSRLTLSEYIKNRKLSEASMDLLHGEKVTDVALKYGYQSMDGFT
jgi:AraC family transcriptional regulator